MLHLAMQMWTLGRFLPLAIGHLVANGGKFWLNFICLLDILFARSISIQDCAYLEALISDHHTSFKELYNVNMTPKLHNMVHMPQLLTV